MGLLLPRPVRASVLAVLALGGVSGRVRGAEPAHSALVGDTAWALPGVVRVSVPGTAGRRIALAGTAGYGLTEAQSETDGVHHRVLSAGAVAYAPWQNLELALRFDGRYDLHPDDGRGHDSGFVGDPRLLARFGGSVAARWLAGLEAGLWLPGKDAPSIDPSAATAQASLLAAWLPNTKSVIAASLGFRLDRSEDAAPDRTRLRVGDRLALGLSEFDAVLAGIGTSISIAEHSALLAEVSCDLLVGSAVPSALKSPLRVDLGLRQTLNAGLDLELLGEATLSQRPGIGPTDPLVPIEPRLSVLAGLRYRFSLEPRPTPVGEPVQTERTERALPSKPETHTVILQLEDDKGAPLSGAKVQVIIEGASKPAEDKGQGRYAAADLPRGTGKVVVELDGYEPAEKPLDFGGGSKLEVELKLQASLPSGELRGLIRSFSGKGISAKVIVDSVGKEAETDEQGYFSLEIPPGQYQVRVEAKGFKPQTRKIRIQQNGVTVLNAELFETRRR